jgi:hypothetical protein
MELTDIIQVTNRSNSTVIYVIPEKGIRREFYPKETKRVEFSEINAVSAQPGGRELIYNYLLVHSPEALHEGLNVDEEPEYWLTEDKIPEWLKTCALDELKDALQFAPAGVQDLIKKYSVEIRLNDMDKRQAILDTLGFNVSSAIALDDASKEDEPSDSAATTANKRRVAKPSYITETEVEEKPKFKINITTEEKE